MMMNAIKFINLVFLLNNFFIKSQLVFNFTTDSTGLCTITGAEPKKVKNFQ